MEVALSKWLEVTGRLGREKQEGDPPTNDDMALLSQCVVVVGKHPCYYVVGGEEEVDGLLRIFTGEHIAKQWAKVAGPKIQSAAVTPLPKETLRQSLREAETNGSVTGVCVGTSTGEYRFQAPVMLQCYELADCN